MKANGEYTYFASDVAYHWDKFQRVDHVIDIWGCDHHGYINRVRCVCDALGYPGQFEVLLGQFVNLLRNGKPIRMPIRMSKRKGTMVTFQELVDEVGADATRYTLISRSSNQAIDFDIEAVKEKSPNNPVYYVQYAHARICSILRKAAGVTPEEAAEMGMDAVAAKAIGENVGRGRCRRHSLHPDLPLFQPGHRFRYRGRQGEEPEQPRVLRPVRARPHLLHPAQGRRRHAGGGR